MQRRNFIQKSLAVLAAGAVVPALSFKAKATPAQPVFKLNYAPHEGMFKNNAGADFIDQIKFMHDQGFRAIEDNGLLKRSVADQEKIGKTLSQLGMNMGVFVIDGGDNWKISLTTGQQDFKDLFLKTCKASVETAKTC